MSANDKTRIEVRSEDCALVGTVPLSWDWWENPRPVVARLENTDALRLFLERPVEERSAMDPLIETIMLHPQVHRWPQGGDKLYLVAKESDLPKLERIKDFQRV